MKLVIEIDEETYKKCKWKNNGVVGLEWWERAIANGTPLEKVLEDIKAEIDGLPSYLTEDGRRMVRKYRVLEIIDSHISGKEQE